MINIYWPYYNRNGISDQLWCLQLIMLDLGLPYTVSDRMDPISKNILIENITPAVSQYINSFCDKHKTKIIIIPTEFLELGIGGSRNIFLNGESIENNDGGNEIFLERMKGLLEISDNIEAFASVADQPSLDEYCSYFNVPHSYQLGLPDFIINLEHDHNFKYDYDLYFSGNLTSYREAQLRVLSSKFKILCESSFVKEGDRIKQLKSCKYNLNVIQNPKWKWLSTMRVLFGLRNGKLTVQQSFVPSTALSDFIIKIEEDQNNIDELAYAKLKIYNSSFSLLDLAPHWRASQDRFVRFCMA